MSLKLALAAIASVALLESQPTIPRTLADADRLEEQVRSSPDDLIARLNLLRFYFRQPTAVPQERRQAANRTHLVWLIEHHPDHPALRESWAAPRVEGERNADAEGF